MGQGHSSEELLVKKIKHALKERGLKVKKNQLVDFFKIVFDICPWFPKDGDVTVRQWKKVGNSLEVFHRQWGPDRIPLTLFSIYNLLYDLIGRREEDVEVASLMTEGEHLLKELSRPSSPVAAPTSVLPSAPPAEAEEPEIIHRGPKTSRANTPMIFPSIVTEGDDSSSEDEEFVSDTVLTKIKMENLTLEQTMKAKKTKLRMLREMSALDSQIKSLEEQKMPIETFPLQLRSGKTRSSLPLDNTQGQSSRGRTRWRSRQTSQNGDSRLEEGALEDNNLDDSSEGGESGEDREDRNESPSSERQVPDSRRPSANGRARPTARPSYEFFPLDIQFLEKLKAAVMTYGPVAPFTITLLESYTEEWLLPREFYQLAKATLTGGDYVLWRSEATDAAQEIALKNRRQPATREWTARMILGNEPYDTLEAQKAYTPGLLAQVRQAFLTAWKRLPDKAGKGSSLTLITQEKDESYSSFINRLMETAEKLFGPQELDSPFLKQLAYENANPACQDILKHHRQKTLPEYVKLCAQSPMVAEKRSVFVAMPKQKQQLCFNCRKPGHMARDCPSQKPWPKRSPETRPPIQYSNEEMPLCPRCEKGRHSVKECRSVVDAHGRLLGSTTAARPAVSGNYHRGQSRAPFTRPMTKFVAETSPESQTPPDFFASPPTAQAWNCAPPPEQY